MWFELRSEAQERIAKGLPPVPANEADTMTPEETVAHMTMLASQLNAQFVRR